MSQRAILHSPRAFRGMTLTLYVSRRTGTSSAVQKMLIKAAINGSRRKSEHAGIPETPSEIASAALECTRAGAGAIHFHVRGDEGQETLQPESLASSVAAVRSKIPSVPVGVSTGAWIVPDPEIRLELIRRWQIKPDFASVNFDEAGAVPLAKYLLNGGIGVEAGLSSQPAAECYIRSGIASSVLRILIEPPEYDLHAALETVHNIKKMLAIWRLDLPVVLHGTESTTWELLDEAIRRGHDIRIGFEDTLRLPDGQTAPNNGTLVGLALRRVRHVSPHLNGS